MTRWRGSVLTYDNTKTVKGEELGYGSFIFMGSPAKESGYNACASSSAGCREVCIYYAGMGVFPNVQKARIRKTIMYFTKRREFLELVNKDIKSAIRWSKKNHLTPCFRLDGTTDLGIARYFVNEYSDIQFYDYTKVIPRLKKSSKFANWHTTYSLSEDTTSEQMNILLTSPSNIAVPFRNVPEPGRRVLGRRIASGDETDLRFLDGRNKIITLKVKGRGRKSANEFIVNNASELETRFTAAAC